MSTASIQAVSSSNSSSSFSKADSRIKVYCRVRPVPSLSSNYQFLVDSHPPAIVVRSPFRCESKRAEFSELLQDDDQLPVFLTCCLPLLHNFVLEQEANILLTSGITSSGKSYTMKGDADHPGMIPLALSLLFSVFNDKLHKDVLYRPKGFNDVRFIEDEHERSSITDQLEKQSRESMENVVNSFDGIETSIAEQIEQLKTLLKAKESWEHDDYSIWISFYEIYNNQVYDLLGKRERAPLNIAHENGGGGRNNAYVEGLVYMPTSTANEAYRYFVEGQARTHMGSTNLNANSSRAHSFFNIRLIRHDRRTNLIVTSMFTFCDLAGAERVNKTNNAGSRLDESNKINQSLMTLNRCITSIMKKQKYVSFRDTKLTHVLQPFLSGSGRVSIIFTLNPSTNLLEESYFSMDMCTEVQTIRQSTSVATGNMALGRRELTLKRPRCTLANPSTPTKRSKLPPQADPIDPEDRENSREFKLIERLIKKNRQKVQNMEKELKMKEDNRDDFEEKCELDLMKLEEEEKAKLNEILSSTEAFEKKIFEIDEAEMLNGSTS